MIYGLGLSVQDLELVFEEADEPSGVAGSAARECETSSASGYMLQVS